MYLSKSDIETIFNSIKIEDAIRIWENMYEKATEEIVKNDVFKSYVDTLINSEAYTEIFNYVKEQTISSIAYENSTNTLPLESIKLVIETGSKITEGQVLLSEPKEILVRTSIIMIDKCIRQAFVEKLAEFVRADLSN